MHEIAERCPARPVRPGTVVARLDKAVVLSAQRHQVTWTARTPCVVRVMGGDFFRHPLTAESCLRDHVLHYLSAQLTGARQERIDRDTAGPPVRIARWLAGQRVQHGPLVPLPAGQQGVAEQLGLSRVTVNRALQSFQRSGVVRSHRRAVLVLDADALLATAARE